MADIGRERHATTGWHAGLRYRRTGRKKSPRRPSIELGASEVAIGTMVVVFLEKTRRRSKERS